MSRYDYEQSKQIAQQDHSFYALIMAAMRQADSDNIELLAEAFPATHAELRERYDAPGGVIETDLDYEQYMQWRNEVERKAQDANN